MKRLFGAVLVALLVAVAAVQAAAPVAVDPEMSKITATMRQMGVPVEGRFKQLSGTVLFDADDLAQSTARLVIDTTSFDIGMSDFNKEVAKPEWLDSKNHPEAVFEAQGLTALGGDRYEVTGTLTLKGKTVEITTQLAVSRSDQGLSFSGEWPLKRQDFEIGGSGWEGVVDETVLVRFTLFQPTSP